LFLRAQDFVHKHLLSKHPDELAAALASVGIVKILLRHSYPFVLMLQASESALLAAFNVSAALRSCPNSRPSDACFRCEGRRQETWYASETHRRGS
jgi:hypothetical protein